MSVKRPEWGQRLEKWRHHVLPCVMIFWCAFEKSTCSPINHKSCISYLSEKTERPTEWTDNNTRHGHSACISIPLWVCPIHSLYVFVLWPSFCVQQACVCVWAMADACWGLSQWFVYPAEWVCCLSLKQPSREKQSVTSPSVAALSSALLCLTFCCRRLLMLGV